MPAAQFQLLPCALPGVLAVKASSRHRFARHTHEQFGIGVLERGAQRSASGRGEVEAVAGDIITVNPGEVHDGMPLDEAGRAWRILYFNPEIVAPVCHDVSEGAASLGEFLLPVISDRASATVFAQLFEAMTGGDSPDATLRRDSLLLMLLARTMDCRRSPLEGNGTPAAVAHALARIDDDPSMPVSLDDLANASGLSRFQVLRAFTRATGLTPHAYLVQRRIDLARRLIARGEPLADAAIGSGFADQSHMTRIFVRKYGLSPSAYAAVIGRHRR
ncbi:AraC family transcriptional regulator [Cupriavidus gilardii]|uniref:AraC family transcriptional regulator n=1 Tax=Cupriavidus gilardii TaxID=82541 RepID=UPI0015747666|nr:AraC family transcriptional regulator [Cupriavidus gilardii]NSX03020.1 AraC family transcriptional regulator [Cupriavidus gilardii]